MFAVYLADQKWTQEKIGFVLSASVLVTTIRRNHLRRYGQVTFILAIFIVYEDDHMACF